MSGHDEPTETCSGEAGPADRWQRVWSHRERLLQVARRRSANLEDAEDAVHEAMVRATERSDVDEARLGAWLTSVTIRLCVDRFRQVGRETEAHARSVRTTPVQSTVEEVVCDRAEATWLAGRTTDLPDRQEQVLALRAQGLDLAQIAQQTGLSYQAARSLLARARRTLLAALAGTLSVAVWLWRGRPWASGGGVPTATLASAAVTLAIAGLGLVTPFQAEADPDPQLRPYETPFTADPPRSALERANPAYEPAVAGLPTDSRYGLVLLADADPARSSPPSADPSAPQSSPFPGVPDLPEAPDPALPTAPHVVAVVPPSALIAQQPAPVQPVELDSDCASDPCDLLATDARLLPH